MKIKRKLIYSVDCELNSGELNDDDLNDMIAHTTITGVGNMESVTLQNGKEVRVHVDVDTSTVVD